VHRVIGDDRDETTVGPVDANEAELTVDGAVRVQTNRYSSIGVLRAPVDVRERDTRPECDARRLQLLARRTDRLDERCRRAAGVLAVPVVIRSAEQHLVHVRGPDFRCGVRMCHGPQDVLRIDTGALLQIAHDAVVQRR
jgi:hypothetical protein